VKSRKPSNRSQRGPFSLLLCSPVSRRFTAAARAPSGNGPENFLVPFPIFSKIEVNGPNAHPLYRFLRPEQKGHLSRDMPGAEMHTPEAIEPRLAELLAAQ
jgi:hypothetical protein